tara:strand:- start:874 stop:1209 length:336 start_codon:yes stop_codon:yes gene_type:complete
MTISYDKTWEVMNNLEESFNRIKALEDMVEDLIGAVNNGDQESIVDISHAINAYLPVYCRQYEAASLRAWNNTVLEVKKIDNPYRSVKDSKAKLEETLKHIDYDNIDIDLS